jgi:hypothetical protein
MTPYLLAFCKRQCRIYWLFASGSPVDCRLQNASQFSSANSTAIHTITTKTQNNNSHCTLPSHHHQHHQQRFIHHQHQYSITIQPPQA